MGAEQLIILFICFDRTHNRKPMTVKELITDKILPLKTTDTIALAIEWMEENKVAHLPVLNGTKYVGMIPEQPLYESGNTSAIIQTLSHYYEPHFVYETQHCFDAIRLVAEFDLTLLPVLAENNAFLGIITLNDLIKKYAEGLSISNPGSIIILEVNQRDYSLEEISRIIESNDAKILSANINSSPDTMLMEVTIKINKLDAGSVLQTFNRYNYIIKASYGEDEYVEGLQDRYNSLMNYLNV